MRNAISRLLSLALLSGATGLLVLGHPVEVRAQSVFCPPPFILSVNGSCVDPAFPHHGAFSGAAVASQALSELSETTTQESTQNTVKAVSERREQEKERCAEGFSRVDGTCQRNPPPVSEAAPVVPAGPPEKHPLKTTKKPKAAAIAREQAPEAAPKIVRRAPLPPPTLLPVAIEPAVRIGTWTQVYGDYEKRDATGPGVLNCCFGGVVPPLTSSTGLALSIQSRTGTVGFLAGADLTSRGLYSADDGLIVGLTSGYVSSDLDLNSSSFSSRANVNPGGNSSARVHANLSGPTTGLYATYFNGGFSSDLTLKVDALTLNETFNELLVTTNAMVVPFAGGGLVGLLNATVAGNLRYRFDLYPNFWVEPTVGAQYTNSSYGSGAAQLSLDDGSLVMVQGGARFGTTTLINDRVLMTSTLTGLAYDDVLVAGGFIPTATSSGENLLVQADEGHVRGRGILAFNFDCGYGITSFVQGEVRGGSGLFGAGGKAGVRYQW
jgi:Autotransporter beta-domain